ncbi:capsule assembly Wzi family protein [Pedobacter sp.]|uniref:capsule assembly Wzi family protein n=1 Tax=Pedobacter sp. TaxID=1411316 RepID=UPI003D7F81F8
MNYYTINIPYSKKLFCTISLLILVNQIHAQIPDIKYEIESQATITTDGAVPFWMRSNQYGSFPLSGGSGSLLGRAHLDYNEVSKFDSINLTRSFFDWGFGLEARANLGKKSNFNLIEAYGKFKAGIFQMKFGRSKEVMGINGDTALSSGNFAVSGNALGIPKAEISIPNYYKIPLFNGLISVKGNFAHGWIGKAEILDQVGDPKSELFNVLNKHPTTYYHQKSLYILFGKSDWKLKLQGGFNHQAYWGNEKAAYGSRFSLSPMETFLYVITGKAYGEKSIPRSKIGNQIGSIDMAIDYRFNNLSIILYRQNFYDTGALSKLANIKDGLNGIRIRNNKNIPKKSNFHWNTILFEFLYTKDQAGYPWSKPTNSGDEDYYNNYYYKKGWSYYGQGIGSPFITTKSESKKGQASDSFDYFINNRVIAFHTGISANIYNWEFQSKISYSLNYGTFSTSEFGKSTGPVVLPELNNNIFKPVNQLNVYFQGLKSVKNSYKIGLATALDRGNLLNNSFGFQMKIIKVY